MNSKLLEQIKHAAYVDELEKISASPLGRFIHPLNEKFIWPAIEKTYTSLDRHSDLIDKAREMANVGTLVAWDAASGESRLSNTYYPKLFGAMVKKFKESKAKRSLDENFIHPINTLNEKYIHPLMFDTKK